jgi:hypothetical protein
MPECTTPLVSVVICPQCLDVYIEEQPETCAVCGVATVSAILKAQPELSHA